MSTGPSGTSSPPGGPRRGLPSSKGWSPLCNGVVAFDDTGVGTPAAARLFQRWVASLPARDLLAADPRCVGGRSRR